MENNAKFYVEKQVILGFLLFFMSFGASAMFQQDPPVDFTEYKGRVVNQNKSPVPSAYLTVDGTNISTITNAEGYFSLKIPDTLNHVNIRVSALRYHSKTLPLQFLKSGDPQIILEEAAEELSEISIFTAKDAKRLIAGVLKKRVENYISEPVKMTAFYRESIKKRRNNVSLSEAVVNIYKQPYSSGRKEDIAIVKARKSADYDKLDTLAIKFRGGPFNTLYVDLIKYPDPLFGEEGLDNYRFDFAEPARINDRYLYVVDFEELNKEYPWYFGKMFIDAESLTLVKATFNLNVDNKKEAARMFVKRKPGGTKVYPVEVRYEINYREQDGKWFYGYGNAFLEFVVNWKRKLFNSRYTVDSEMAITNREANPNGRPKKDDSFINERVIMIDDVSGFADTAFWGDNNIIEPDKSIQNAIDKIQRQLRIE